MMATRPARRARVTLARSWPSSSSVTGGGRLADTACCGRCHAPIKSRQTSPTGDERQNKRKSDPRVDSLKESQLAAGRDLLLSVGRRRRLESQQQASKREFPCPGRIRTPRWCPYSLPVRGGHSGPALRDVGTSDRCEGPELRGQLLQDVLATDRSLPGAGR